MNSQELIQQLKQGRVAALTTDEWDALAGEAEVLERHSTFIAGDLLIVKLGQTLAAVEQPSPTERVVRMLRGQSEAEGFVRQRLEEYERMWDGCGCKIDYYA